MRFSYRVFQAFRKLENARQHLVRTYGRIDVNEPSLLWDVVRREDGMLMVSSDETIDAEELIFSCIEEVINEQVRGRVPYLLR